MRPDRLGIAREPPQPARGPSSPAPPAPGRSGDSPNTPPPSPRSPRRSPPPRTDGAASTDPATSTCVRVHARHLDRRGRNDTVASPRSRIDRRRANPHGANTPAHDGHDNPPPRSSDSTSPPRHLPSASGCHLRHPESPPDATTKLAGGLSRVYERAKPDDLPDDSRVSHADARCHQQPLRVPNQRVVQQVIFTGA